MGNIQIELPTNLSSEFVQEMQQHCIFLDDEDMPMAVGVYLTDQGLTLSRDISDSGFVSVPWLVKGFGCPLVSTATLIERNQPYAFPLELARGKIHQVRSQLADWTMKGFTNSAAACQLAQDATKAFTRALARHPSETSLQFADSALILAFEAAEELVQEHVMRLLGQRRQKQASLEHLLGCQVSPLPPEHHSAKTLKSTFKRISVPFLLGDICPTEDSYHWEKHDRFVEWAVAEGLVVTGGPLFDFASAQMPAWVYAYDKDRNRLAHKLCEFVITVLQRYGDAISTWQLTAASNLPGTFSLADDEVLWLTIQLCEVAQQTIPDAEYTVGISQPWGEFLANRECLYTPFLFADTLLRSGAAVAALDLEIIMGVKPRGSYCRDRLALSSLFDLYAVLGVPLQATIGYPASTAFDIEAAPDFVTGAGWWRDGLDVHSQSDWAADFAGLLLSKSYVRSVQWCQYSDAESHLLPNCGLLDTAGEPRPALHRFRRFRDQYLKSP